MKKFILSFAVLMALPAAVYGQEDNNAQAQDIQKMYTKLCNLSVNEIVQESQDGTFTITINGKEYSIPGFTFDQPQVEQPAPEQEEKEDAPTPENEVPEEKAPSANEEEQPAAEVEVPQEETTQEEAPAAEQAEGTEEQQNVAEQETENEQDVVTESEFEQEVIRLTNQEREKNGLQPLVGYSELSDVARDKSADMRDAGYFDHNSPNYGSPFDMMDAYGIDYRGAGENIAAGQRTPQEVVNGWMNSEGHRANILNPDFTHIGVGHVEGGSYGHYWTQMFVTK